MTTRTRLASLLPTALAIAVAYSPVGGPRPAAARQPASEWKPDKVVVFCAGIEKYSDDSVAKLNRRGEVKSIAEDASEVYDALTRLPNADAKRSRKLLADDVPAANPRRRLQNAARWNKPITKGDLQTELEQFLEEVTEKDLVIIYLGGHGVIRPGNRASLLMSDSKINDKGVPEKDFLVAEILLFIHSRIDKKDTKVLVFGNMCYAGAEKPSPVPKDAENSLAYIPAVGGSETFENEKYDGRSHLAHHLLSGLAGAAADKKTRKVTTDSLARHLRKEITDLPEWTTGLFGSQDVLLTSVSRTEAELRELLAEGLIGLAWDADETDRKWLLTLADRHLQQRLASEQENRFPALVKRLQCQLAAGATDAAAETARMIAEEKGELPEGHPYASALKEVRQEVKAAGKVGGEKYRVVVAGGVTAWNDNKEAINSSRDFIEKGLGRWAEIFGNRVGADRVVKLPAEVVLQPFGRPPAVAEKRQLLEELTEQLKTKLVPKGKEEETLILVYYGDRNPLTESGADNSPDPHGPQLAVTFWDSLKGWPKVILIWCSTSDGALQSMPADLVKKVSILCPDPSGAAFQEGFTGSFLETFATLFERGLGPEWKDELIRMWERRRIELLKTGGPGRPTTGRQDWRPRPSWSGQEMPRIFGATTWGLVSGIRKAPLPTRRWAYDHAFRTPGTVAEEWLGGHRTTALSWVDEEAKLSKENGEADRVWRTLRLAALREALGRYPDAAKAYRDFTNALTVSPNQDGKAAVTVVKARALVDDLTTVVTERIAQATKKRFPPRLHLVLVAARDYESPHIADLDGPERDVEVWKTTVERITREDRKTPAEKVDQFLQVYKTAKGTKKEIDEKLSAAIKACQDDDVIIFVFSGRGYQDATGRYLIPADAKPVNLRSFRDFTSPTRVGEGDPSKLLAPLVNVDELVRSVAGQGKSLVGVFDCQFTPPEVGEDPDPLVKHLLAMYPRRPADAPRLGIFPEFAPVADRDADGTKAPSASESRGWVEVATRNTGGLAARPPILIWWQGRLAENPSGQTDPQDGDPDDDPAAAPPPRSKLGGPPAPDPGAASPFSRALLGALPGATSSSYQDWIRKAALHASEPRLFSGMRPIGRFVVQGPVERPLLTPNPPDDTLRLLLRDYYRQRHNLDLALAVLNESPNETVLRSPLDELTRGVLFVYQARLSTAAQMTGGLAEQNNFWKAAAEHLTKLDIDALLPRPAQREQRLADTYTIHLIEALKHTSGTAEYGSPLGKLREKLQRHDQLRTENAAQLLIDLTRSSIRSTPNVRVEESLGILDRFEPRLKSREEELRGLLRSDSQALDLVPVEYVKGKP